MSDVEENEKDEIRKLLICPISTLQIEDPVVAYDGYTYDRCNIEKWLQDHDTSPMTNMKMKKTLIPNQLIKTILQILFKENVNEKEIITIEKIHEYITLKKYDDIVSGDISLDIWMSDYHHGKKYIDYIFKASLTAYTSFLCLYDITTRINKDTIIHYICFRGSYEHIYALFEHIKKNKIDIEIMDQHGWYPYHYVCCRNHPKIMRLFSIIQFDFYKENKNKNNVIHLMAKYQTYENFYEFMNTYNLILDNKTKIIIKNKKRHSTSKKIHF